MQIELGLIGAVSLMGGAVQLRILHVLQRKLKEIAEEQRRRDEEADLDASGKFADLEREKTEWENDHPPLRMHARSGSGHSATPLINEDPTASSHEGRSSTLTLNATRGRYTSGVSDFMAAPPAPDDEGKVAPKNQARRGLRGLLPNLDFGTGIQDDVPTGFITEAEPESKESKEAKDAKKAQISAELEELARKEELLTEIQTIRRSIDALRSDGDSDETRSRRISLTSRRTLSCDLGTVMGSRSHTRPPRQPDPRIRTNSMEFSQVIDAPPAGASISRPTSAPLRNEDWDSYVKDRKLLQPPSGVTAPIPTTPVSSRVPMAPAVSEALAQRKRRESSLLDINPSDSTPRKSSEEDVPVARTLAGMLGLGVKKPTRTSGGIPSVLLQQPGSAPPPEPTSRGLPFIATRSKAASGEATNSHIPLVLPPTRPLKPTSQAIAAPVPQKAESPRVATFEELEERHRHKMRGMQAPLTQAEKEHAEVEAAKNRWERSRAIEREVVSKRQAEKAAQLEREEKGRRKPQDGQGKRGPGVGDSGKTSSNALSADKLAVIGGGHASTSKRQSMMRVEDWQRHQQDVEMGVRPRESRAMASATVPFPAGHGRARASVPRDPPN